MYEVQYREGDCHQDELQRPEHQDRSGRPDCQCELRVPETCSPAELRQIHEPDPRVDDERSKRCTGKGGQNRTEEHHDDRDCAKRHKGVQLAAAPERVVDRRSAPAAADGKTACRPESKISHPQRA